jgi:hypothetical protein
LTTLVHPTQTELFMTTPIFAIAPLRYDPRFEVLEEGEAETTAGMLESLTTISSITFKHSGHATRSVHAKSHGLLTGELTVEGDLPPAYAQGLFAVAASYPVVMRLSTTPGDVLDDKVSTPRGLGLKVIGVAGARVDGSEADATQDFVMVNGPVFLAPTAKKFLGSLKPLVLTTDRVPNLKRAFSAVLRGTEAVIEAVGGESATLKAMGGHPETNPLGETYFSQAPILFGDYMAKVSLVPVAPELTALTGQHVDLSGTPDGLRRAVEAHFAAHGGEWELRVQLCTDIEKMPIEDSSVEWLEEDSPWVTVARVRAQPQAGWSEALSKAVDDGMQFNPWHALAAHRPIGSIMRVRKAAYAMSKRFRFERNGSVMAEPTDLSSIAP